MAKGMAKGMEAATGEIGGSLAQTVAAAASKQQMQPGQGQSAAATVTKGAPVAPGSGRGTFSGATPAAAASLNGAASNPWAVLGAELLKDMEAVRVCICVFTCASACEAGLHRLAEGQAPTSRGFPHMTPAPQPTPHTRTHTVLQQVRQAAREGVASAWSQTKATTVSTYGYQYGQEAATVAQDCTDIVEGMWCVGINGVCCGEGGSAAHRRYIWRHMHTT